VAVHLERNISSAADTLERTIAGERLSRKHGLLQGTDARVKIICLIIAVIVCSLTHSLRLIAALYAGAVILAALSRINPIEFTARVWVFIPLFTGAIALPALFITPGSALLEAGPFTVTRQGLTSASLLLLRVSTCVSFTSLLVLTTPWNKVIGGFSSLGAPRTAVTLLSLSYRYILLLLRSLIELLLARKSRVLGTLDFRQRLALLSQSTGYIFLKSLHLAEGVQMAMDSRGSYLELTGGCEKSGKTGPVSRKALDETCGEDPAASHPAFEIRNATYTYPDGTFGARIDYLDIGAGLCTIMLGPNGSGKSTVLKMLDGLIFPQSGLVKAFGEELNEKRLNDRRFQRTFRCRVGFVFQDPDIQCFSPTVREELAFGPTQRGLEAQEIDRRVAEALEQLGIGELADRYPYRLSGGEKKRVAIASVITLAPDVYLIDEPTAGLDPSTEGVLIDILTGFKLEGRTLIVATQDLLLARHIGDRAVILGTDGLVAAEGPVESILKDRSMLEKAGLIHAHRTPHTGGAAGYKHSHYSEDEI